MKEFCPKCDAPLDGADYCRNCGEEVDDNTINNNTGIISKWKKTGLLDDILEVELACEILEITARKIINREIGSVNNGITNGMILCESIKHLDNGAATINMGNWIKNGCKNMSDHININQKEIYSNFFAVSIL